METISPPITLPPMEETPFLKTSSIMKVDRPEGALNYLVMDHHTNPNHDSSEIGKASMTVLNKVYTTQLHRVRCVNDSHMAHTLQNLHGLDMSKMMVSTLLSEDTVHREKILYNKYVELSNQSSDLFVNKWQKRVQGLFKKLQFPHYVNSGDEMYKKIMMHCRMIESRSSLGPGSFVMLPGELLSILEESPNFMYLMNGEVKNSMFNEVGSINGVKVFTNMYSKGTTVIVGRESKNQQPGTYFIHYDRELLQMENQISMKHETEIRSRYCVVDTTDAHLNYASFEVKIGEKPWWKKIFKL
jgi:hypothetical protein